MNESSHWRRIECPKCGKVRLVHRGVVSQVKKHGCRECFWQDYFSTTERIERLPFLHPSLFE